jgi:hypothetical protein
MKECGNYYYIDKDLNKVEIIEKSNVLSVIDNSQIERLTDVLEYDFFEKII